MPQGPQSLSHAKTGLGSVAGTEMDLGFLHSRSVRRGKYRDGFRGNALPKKEHAGPKASIPGGWIKSEHNWEPDHLVLGPAALPRV